MTAKATVTVDVYASVCNYRADHSANAKALMSAVIPHFAPGQGPIAIP